jgi:hypothetical protein
MKRPFRVLLDALFSCVDLAFFSVERDLFEFGSRAPVGSSALTNEPALNCMSDPRTNTNNKLCFLGLPRPADSWNHTDNQNYNYLMDWYIF